jgi:YfiH family protein
VASADTAAVMAFSGRGGGVSTGPYSEANLSTRVGDDPEAVLANRRRLMERLGLAGRPLVTVSQAHGAEVIDVTGLQRAGGGPPELHPLPAVADGMVARGGDAALMVGVADCAPVLLADAERAVIGALHVGWRGLLAGAVERMAEAFRAAGGRLEVAAVRVGPAIGPCCLAVGEEIRSAVARRHECAAAATRAGEPSIDLRAGVVDALRRAGAAGVELVGGCTADAPDELFSARRDGRTGVQAGVIALRGDR